MNFLKKVFNNIQSVLLVILVIALIIKSCGSDHSKTPKPKVITLKETEYITVKNTTPKYVPKWRTRIDTIFETDSFLIDVDTLAILTDYYAKYYYNDVQDFDSFKLTILDTVTQNMITGRQIKYTLRYPKTTITEKIYINKREVYVGLGGVGNSTQLNYVGGELLYKTKNYKIYGFGGGINQNLQPVISARIYWKIGK
jgi:hypothetical protein